MKKIVNYIQLMRPSHYIKNLLIFVPLFFNESIFDTNKLTYAIYGFIAFCMMASGIYILNDICDMESDRTHPRKKNRPLASGAIKKYEACILSAVLLLVSLSINLICKFSIYAILLFFSYFVINLLYSLRLKHYAYIDVIILAICYILRLQYGSFITDVPLSSYLLLTVFTLSFFFAMGKRRNEMKMHGTEYRQSLRSYSYEFLDKFMYVCGALSIAFYAIWCVSKDDEIHKVLYVWSVPMAIVLLMKYTADIEAEDSEGDPTYELIHDRVFLLISLIFAIYILLVVYVYAHSG